MCIHKKSIYACGCKIDVFDRSKFGLIPRAALYGQEYIDGKCPECSKNEELKHKVEIISKALTDLEGIPEMKTDIEVELPVRSVEAIV